MRFAAVVLTGFFFGLCVAPVMPVTPVHAAATPSVMASVLDRGHVNCGVVDGNPGFSERLPNGDWAGFDVDFCRAVATAVFATPRAVKFIAVHRARAFEALRDSKVDIIAGSAPFTISRDTELSVRVVGTSFFDGQGFLAGRAQVISSVFELSGASVCALRGTGAERAVVDFFKPRGMRYKLIAADRWDEVLKLYESGRCSVLTGDRTLLAYERSKMPRARELVLLPENIRKRPLGPVVRAGDERWFGVVRWTLMALIQAEELGIATANLEEMKQSPLVGVRRFLGLESSIGKSLGLQPTWAAEIVRYVGNYAEVFDRHLGPKTPLRLRRGLNRLWSDGGLLIAAPFR